MSDHDKRSYASDKQDTKTRILYADLSNSDDVLEGGAKRRLKGQTETFSMDIGDNYQCTRYIIFCPSGLSP